jgi:hypothetical protein
VTAVGVTNKQRLVVVVVSGRLRLAWTHSNLDPFSALIPTPH